MLLYQTAYNSIKSEPQENQEIKKPIGYSSRPASVSPVVQLGGLFIIFESR